MSNTIEHGAMRERVLACQDTPERAAVLANLDGGAYERASDLEHDLALLEHRDARLAALDQLHATSDEEARAAARSALAKLKHPGKDGASSP